MISDQFESAGEVSRSSIVDVAKRAKASAATVSRVLNGHPHVSEKTTVRVRGAIQELNYSPSSHGRSLRSGRRRTLGLLAATNAADDRLYSEVITNTLVRYITTERYGVAVEFLARSANGLPQVPASVKNKSIDGLMVVGHLDEKSLSHVATWGLPVCLINNRYGHPNFYSASLDDYSGSREAVQYLAASGRKRIAFVHGNIDWPGTNGRYRGFHDAMRELGLNVDAHHVIRVDESQQNYQGGYLATRKLLETSKKIDAIFYVNDWYAVGGLCAAKELGWRVPEDLSIVGYDDAWMAAQTLPALTSVSLEPDEICRRAAAILIRAVENRPQVVTNATIRPKLVVRDSVSPLQEIK